MNEEYDAGAQFSDFFFQIFIGLYPTLSFFYLFSLSSSREA